MAHDGGGGCSGNTASRLGPCLSPQSNPVVETGKLGWELGDGATPPAACLSLWHLWDYFPI